MNAFTNIKPSHIAVFASFLFFMVHPSFEAVSLAAVAAIFSLGIELIDTGNQETIEDLKQTLQEQGLLININLKDHKTLLEDQLSEFSKQLKKTTKSDVDADIKQIREQLSALTLAMGIGVR